MKGSAGNDMRIEISKLANHFELKKIPLPILKSLPEYPAIVGIIENHLTKAQMRKELMLPNLHFNNDTIAVFSDFSGDSKESLYYTYSFLFGSHDHFSFFNGKMGEIRKKYKLDSPFVEIAFKQLHYGPIKRALKDYLIAANNLIPGLLLTIIIDKKVHSILVENTKNTLNELQATIKEKGLGEWDRRVAEKLLRITHIIGYFCALLSKPKQKIFWMTDDDEIVPNKEKALALFELWRGTLEYYAPHDYGTIGATAPCYFEDSDTKDKLMDILSLTDLIAGSIEHYYSRAYKMNDVKIKEEVDQVLVWHTGQGVLLKKLSMIIHQGPNKGWETGLVRFDLKGGQDYFKFEFVDEIHPSKE